MTDRIAGLAIAIFGAAVAVHASGFPAVPGQTVGPGFMPVAIGVGLALCGLVLAARSRPAAAPPSSAQWLRQPRLVLNFALVFADLIFFSTTVAVLGFFITGFVFLTVLLAAFRAPRVWILPIAAAATLAIHYAFYTLLHVPLPWGVLEPLAW